MAAEKYVNSLFNKAKEPSNNDKKIIKSDTAVFNNIDYNKINN